MTWTILLELLGFSSAVLCVTNAYYWLMYCDIGPNGRFSDERVTECTKLYEKLVREKKNWIRPYPENLTLFL